MSSAVSAALRPIPIPRFEALRSDPAAQAFMLLRVVFTVAPILFGLDKFANVMVGDWTVYLAPEFNDLIPGTAADAMHLVGVVEITAGLVVAVIPRFGGLLVAGWLASSSACCSRAATATSPCATSACSSAPWRSPGWRARSPRSAGRPAHLRQGRPPRAEEAERQQPEPGRGEGRRDARRRPAGVLIQPPTADALSVAGAVPRRPVR